EQAHTLSIAELPTHTHVLMGANNVVNTSVDTPAANTVLGTSAIDQYRIATTLVAMDPSAVSNVGGSQAHLNMQPFLILNFCIALQGIFPSPN
ncbi:MAG: hypothetical protein QOH21_1871, partial [Acidobacteriota bacterium]|nr:hypothetical protein [Acidobacteriota bacterium]